MGKSSFLQDFKAFAMRGNVIDMAVGVIIGGAFGKIVSSIVADVIMPPIGLLVGGVNFTDLKLQLKPAEVVDGVEKSCRNVELWQLPTSHFRLYHHCFFYILIYKITCQTESQERRSPCSRCPACPQQGGGITYRNP